MSERGGAPAESSTSRMRSGGKGRDRTAGAADVDAHDPVTTPITRANIKSTRDIDSIRYGPCRVLDTLVPTP